MSFKQMIKRFFVELFDRKHQNHVAQQQQQAATNFILDAGIPFYLSPIR